MATLENSTIDNLLISSFAMEDLGNIDIDKYQKEIFSPTSTTAVELSPSTSAPSVQVSSPHKPLSPHVVPHISQQSSPNAFPLSEHAFSASPHTFPQQVSAHLSVTPHVSNAMQVQPPRVTAMPQLPPQLPPQSQNPSQLHRKVQLGPNFDRLGILNQANEMPPMNAPFFAKALQQNGGTTLGAILQAHQHALQQQMQRENFLLHQAQAAQHQMFQMPMQNMYQQQRLHAMMMERRTDDQIVPNPQIQPQNEHWLHSQGNQHLQQQKQFQVKQEDDDDSSSGRSSVASFKETKPRDHYVIFNDEHHTENMTDEEEDDKSNPRVRPPKNSQFVRYQSETGRCLPTFPEVFSGHVDKLKLKEEQLKQILLRQQMHYGQIPVQPRMNCAPVPIPNNNVFLQQLQQQQQQQHLQQLLLRQQQQQHQQQQHQQQQQQNQHQHHHHQQHKRKQPKQKQQKQQTHIQDVNMEESHKELTNVDIKVEKIDDAMDSEQINTPQQKVAVSEPSYSHLEFLNDVSKDTDDLLSCFENTKDPTKNHNSETDKIDTKENLHTEESPNDSEENNIFSAELDLNNEHSYDNLFNGNSDEHYFQSFKENNLHLLNDLNENKMDHEDEILKLLHSPLDFINDKFLK